MEHWNIEGKHASTDRLWQAKLFKASTSKKLMMRTIMPAELQNDPKRSIGSNLPSLGISPKCSQFKRRASKYLHSSRETQRGQLGLSQLWCNCFLAAGLPQPVKSLHHQHHISLFWSCMIIISWPVLYSKWYAKQKCDKAIQQRPTPSPSAYTARKACTWPLFGLWWW